MICSHRRLISGPGHRSASPVCRPEPASTADTTNIYYDCSTFRRKKQQIRYNISAKNNYHIRYVVLCIRQPQHTRNGQESQQRGVASIRESAPICKCRRKARKWHSERSEESKQPDSLPQAPAPQGRGFPSSIGCGPYRRASNARPYAPHFIRPPHTGRRGRRPLHRKLFTPRSTLHMPQPEFFARAT